MSKKIKIDEDELFNYFLKIYYPVKLSSIFVRVEDKDGNTCGTWFIDFLFNEKYIIDFCLEKIESLSINHSMPFQFFKKLKDNSIITILKILFNK